MNPSETPRPSPPRPRTESGSEPEPEPGRPSCPVCGGSLVEIKAKLICSRCRAICETCCEGGPG